jgi:hypothetical protein
MDDEKKVGKGNETEGPREVVDRRGRYTLIRFRKADGSTGYLLEKDGTPELSDEDGYEFHERVGMVSGSWELFLATRDAGESWTERPRPGRADAGDSQGSTEEDESCNGRAMPQLTPERRPENQETTDTAPLDAADIFGEVIFAYTRKQAIEDRTLVDVSETAREAGFKIPVALTRAVWSEFVEVPEGVVCQDEKGRLWDVVWMCRYGIAQAKNRDASEFLFQLHVRNDNREGEPPLVTLKAVCGPDDDRAPCITIMLPEED